MESFSIGKTLSRTFGLITATLPSVGLFMLIVQIVNAAIQFVSQRMMMGSLTAAQAGGDAMAALAVFTSFGYWSMLAGSLLIGSFSFAGSLAGFLNASDGRAVSLGDCAAAGASKVLPVLGLTLLWYLGVGLGWILFVIPGLILMTMWSVAMPALVGEDLGVFASFGRSRALTKGSRMMIFVTLLVVLVLFYAVFFGLAGMLTGTGMITGASMMGLAAAARGDYWFLLVSIPSGWIFGMLTSALLASIYIETVTIREGGTEGSLEEVFS